jgi:hypothetical protein
MGFFYISTFDIPKIEWMIILSLSFFGYPPFLDSEKQRFEEKCDDI